MRRQVGLIRAQRVHHAQGGHQAAEGAEHAEVRFQAAFWEGVAEGVGGDAAGGGEGGGNLAQS